MCVSEIVQKQELFMMNENRSQPDQQQKQPKKPKKTSLTRKLRDPKALFFLLAKKLRDPKTLLFLIQAGFRVNQVGKWLLEIEPIERLLELLGL